MSSTPPVGASFVAQAQYASATNATALMECLCQLQDQGGYQQMASAILSGNLDRALRTYKMLQLRAPRKTEATEAAPDTGDALEQLFDTLGRAITAGDDAGARAAFQALQQAVEHAHAHHTHGKSRPLPRQADASDPSDTPLPDNDAPPGHVDIRV